MSRKTASFKSFSEWWNCIAGGDPTDGSFWCSVTRPGLFCWRWGWTHASHLCLRLIVTWGFQQSQCLGPPQTLIKFVKGWPAHWDLTACLSLQFGFPASSVLCRILWLVGCMFFSLHTDTCWLPYPTFFLSFFLIGYLFYFYIHCEIKPQKIPHSFYNIFIS